MATVRDLKSILKEYEVATGVRDIGGRRLINALQLHGGKSIPRDMKTYNRIKAKAKTKFKKWPSAYASGWLVKEYKKAMKKKHQKPYMGEKTTEGITRWFKEKWHNVCKLPKIVACGRPKTDMKSWKKDYPYCRPRFRVNSKTPATSKELSKAEIARRCTLKRKRPMRRVK